MRLIYCTIIIATIKFITRIINLVKKILVFPIDNGDLISPGKSVLIIGTKISNENPFITSDIVVSNNALTRIFCTVICNASSNII